MFFAQQRRRQQPTSTHMLFATLLRATRSIERISYGNVSVIFEVEYRKNGVS